MEINSIVMRPQILETECEASPRGGGALLVMAYIVGGSARMVYLVQAPGIWKIGISQVEVYNRVRKSVIW